MFIMTFETHGAHSRVHTGPLHVIFESFEWYETRPALHGSHW